MTDLALPLPEEPRALKAMARTLLEQAPAAGLRLVADGTWIADPLWQLWRDRLAPRGIDRAAFGAIVAGYQNELRLWAIGERPWEHCVGGLAGRVVRRVRPVAAGRRDGESGQGWQRALGRVGLAPDAGEERLAATIADLRLLYDVTHGDEHHAVVWSGGRPRDPEVNVGEGRSAASAAAALAEALGQFLLHDPGFPLPLAGAVYEPAERVGWVPVPMR